MVKASFVIGLAAVLAVGCSHNNDNFCPGRNPDNNCSEPAVDGGTDGSATCGSNADCTGAGASVCDTTVSPHECVECTSGDHAACSGTTPVCGTDDTCGACTMDSQCTDSGVCMPDGSCAVAADVLYADPTGSGSDCTKIAPCDLPTAVGKVTTTQSIVHLNAGTYDLTDTLTLTGTMTLVGRGAGVDRNAGASGPTLSLHSAANVTIDFLEVFGGDGVTGDGIDCPAAILSVEQALIDNNDGSGISTNGCTLTLSRSTLTLNSGGGIDMVGATTFTISNNFIYRNGNSSTSSVGGASLTPTGTSTFEFNTVVDNEIKNSTVLAGGVLCDQSGFTAPNNIIARNDVNSMASATNANTLGQCTYPTSFIMADLTSLALGSPDNTPYDYHLTAASTPAIDQATADSTVKVDVDGDSRPQGNGYDIGADEYKP